MDAVVASSQVSGMGMVTGKGAGALSVTEAPHGPVPPFDMIVQLSPAASGVGCGPLESTSISWVGQKFVWQSGAIWAVKVYAGWVPMVKGATWAIDVSPP
jgi:hypothetical protein